MKTAVKFKKGNVLQGKKEIKNQWTECCNKLYHDNKTSVMQ